MIHIFIINNFAGSGTAAQNLREHLSKKDDLRYFVFNTINAGFETTIVRKIFKYFEDEKLRFYCCGGSGTMRNILSGLDDLTNYEVAFYPCGLTNDFLKCFGENSKEFEDIDNLIDGKVIKVDYINTNHGICLNTVSLGLDAKVVESMVRFRPYSIFGSEVPYVLSLIYSIFSSKTREFEITIDGKKEIINSAEIVFGNGEVLGGNMYISENPKIDDGLGSYFIVEDKQGISQIPYVQYTMKKEFDKMRATSLFGTCQSITIRSLDGKPIYINQDGEFIEGGEFWHAEIVNKGLNFVVPKSVSI